MSPLQTIQELYRAFAAKDMDTIRRLFSPDLVWIQNEGFPGGGTWRGPEAVFEDVFGALSQQWEDWSFDAQEYLEAEETVVVLGDYAGRHRGSGRSFRAAAAHVYGVRDGRVTRFRQYTDTHVIRAAMEPAS